MGCLDWSYIGLGVLVTEVLGVVFLTLSYIWVGVLMTLFQWGVGNGRGVHDGSSADV